MIFDNQWDFNPIFDDLPFSPLFNKDSSVKQKSETIQKWGIFRKKKIQIFYHFASKLISQKSPSNPPALMYEGSSITFLVRYEVIKLEI